MTIGWDGKTVREMLEESERLFATDGRYRALTELPLWRADPLKFERFQAKLIAACIGARDVVKYACASPGTRELGELIFMVFSPEGDCAGHGMGLVSHIVIEGNGIRWLLRNDYETDPGIEEGDIFFCNDPYLMQGAHPADTSTFVPIFWQGELIGWATGIAHVLEVGGMVPGSFNVTSVEMFTDGYRIPMQKVGVKDRLKKEFLLTLQRNSRSGTYWILDEKAKAAGCVLIRDKILELVGEYGIGYYKQALREIVELGRIDFLARIRERLVPGRYRAPQFCAIMAKGQEGFPAHAARDALLHLPLDLSIDGAGTMRFDYDGVSPRGSHSHNCYGGADHVLFSILTSFFGYDGRANAGIRFATERHYPEGTLLNPATPFAGTGIPWAIHTCTGMQQSLLLCQGLFSRGYLEEVLLHSGGNWRNYDAGGIDENGMQFGGTNFEFGVLSSGARATGDGFLGLVVWMPECDMGNAEIWEVPFPHFLYLGRRFVKDCHGYGRYRGGPGWQSAFLISAAPPALVVTETSVTGATTFEPYGLYGGYPSPGSFSMLLTDTNLHALIAAGATLPHDVDEALQMLGAGTLKAADVSIRKSSRGRTNVHSGDYYIVARGGGAGLGDPLERAAQAVGEDLDSGQLSAAVAANVYGVAVARDPGGAWSVDEAVTAARRAALRADRKRRARPFRDWWQAERARVAGGALPEVARTIYAECTAISPKFRAEFASFWQLPEPQTGPPAGTPEV